MFIRGIIIACSCGLLFSCVHKNTSEVTEVLRSQLVNDSFFLSGTYYWNFKLMGGVQKSNHSFFRDSIKYSMRGKVYSTDYTMKKLSFDGSQGKWIGEDSKGIVYVLFFKEINGNIVSIYKHKCKSNGLQEAINFDLPLPDATEDHGWNRYSTNEVVQEEVLPIHGHYVHNNEKLIISDHEVIMNGKAFTKLSFHKGERRWVGISNKQYLQLFFQSVSNDKGIPLSVHEYTSLESAYKTKYTSVKFDVYDRL